MLKRFKALFFKSEQPSASNTEKNDIPNKNADALKKAKAEVDEIAAIMRETMDGCPECKARTISGMSKR